MDALGAVSLAWEVSKDLYAFYRALKNCDTDIRELRAQICDLRSLSAAVSSILKRHRSLDIVPEHEVLVDSALADCENAAKALKDVSDRLTVDGISSPNAVSKLKVLGRRMLYPFQTETIAQLTRDVEIGRSEADERRARTIVETLAHPHLRRRWEDVPNAPQSTFEWLLDPGVPKSTQTTGLLSFLNSEHGLVWIRGRPASGKSTLMKFLADTRRTDDVMKEWATDHDITIASHYFWAPGSTMQKSQQGMLQSLVYQLLLADLTIVPAVCWKRWEDRVSSASWSIEELWSCLETIVLVTSRRICFLIDGLDECQPESDLGLLAARLKKLSEDSDKVKMVVSSRPWPVLEQCLSGSKGYLTMEDTNRHAIIQALRGGLEAYSNCRLLLNGVRWECMDSEMWFRNTCPIHNQSHGEVHVLLHGIIDKAQGNFLWVSLVLDKFSPLLGLRPIAALQKLVNEFPSELDEYFRRMIMDRIHTSFLSDTAMAIRIATHENRLSYFWFLNIYTDEGDSVLADPQFSLDLPFTPFDTDDEIEAMNVKARALISTCCRDILTVGTRQPSRMLDGVSGDESELDRLANLAPRDAFVTFTHRTVFDFLRTPEMHRLLSEHVPPHFEDRIVAVHLELAQWKLAEPGRSLSAGGCGIALCEMLGYGASAGDAHLKLPGKLASVVEDLAISYLELTENQASSSSSTSGLLADNVKRLACHLARYDLYTFVSKAMKADQSGTLLFQRTTPSGKSIQDPALLFFALGIQSRAGTHVELLRLLLQHPASIDPNALHRSADEPGLVSPWYAFLRRIYRNTLDTAGEESSYKVKMREDGEEWAKRGHSETFADAHIQEAIALMIRHGADESILDENGLDRHDGKDGELAGPNVRLTSFSIAIMAGFRNYPHAHRSTLAFLSILLAIAYVAWQAVLTEENPTGQLRRSSSKDRPPILLPPTSLVFDQSLPINQGLREDVNVRDASRLQERALFDGLKLKNLYNKYKKKGKELRCVLEGTKATSTPWTDYGALETWGWQLTEDDEAGDYSHVQKQCTGVDLGDLSAGTSVTWDHIETTEHTTNGKQVLYYATNAEYINVFFPAAGVIMANVNYGPGYKTSQGLGSLDPWPKDAPLPKIKQWSDIVALTWLHLTTTTGSHRPQNLRWLFRRIIRNDDTQNVIGYVCKQKRVGQARPKGATGPPWQAPVWPGLVVRREESGDEGDFFNALLATPNANGVVWLLAQHREQLGWKTVKSIRVWSDLPSSVVYSPSMLLEIGDVEGEGG
ncbi:hypothetical protein KC347_g2388 [Hortaea werneckii]|nr:hypothetical protein KC347_g2388 [Hortaea werneckii]